jgi:hypothetical protein
MQVFPLSNRLAVDKATHRLLETLAAHPRVLASARQGWFIEALEALLPNEAEAVYKLCREVVRLYSGEFGSIQTAWAMHAANLTTVAITLQRLEEPYRGMGLELFEALLDIGLPDADATLRELDRRLPQPGMPRPRRLRRRRQRPGTEP